MEATLEAVKREGRGKNEANRLRASGRIPGVVYGTASKGKAPEGVAVAVDPKALLRILHSDSGANTLITLKLDGGAVAGDGQGISARPDHASPAARGLLSARDGQGDHRHGADRRQGRAEGRQAAGRPARLRHARHPGAVPADGHPRAHRRGRERVDAPRVDPRARTGGRSEVEGGH